MNKKKNLEKVNDTLKNSKKGITLIALVVTIVVLLILASVSITAVFGDNGLLKLAKEAAEKTNEATQNEKGNIGNLTNYIKSLNWDSTKVTAVTTKDGGIVPVPKGFVGSGIDGENTIENGFVIYEGEEPVTDVNVENERKERNQFVWVPVFDETPIYKTNSEGKNIGLLYDFGNYDYSQEKFVAKDPVTTIEWSDTGSREPDILYRNEFGDAELGKEESGINALKSIIGITATNEDGSDNIAEILNKWKEQLQNEFDYLVASVNKYKGFYIGRYETGNLKSDKENIPVVKPGNEEIKNEVKVSGNWYYLYQTSKNISSKKNEKIKSSVTSSMIWGCQWDAIMNWFLKNEKTREYVTNSNGKGNYAGTQEGESKQILTGSNPIYAVKNIYDMAGNDWEWTIEGCNTDLRIMRGGAFWEDTSKCTVSSRYGAFPGDDDVTNGGSFRATLIINL